MIRKNTVYVTMSFFMVVHPVSSGPGLRAQTMTLLLPYLPFCLPVQCTQLCCGHGLALS